MPPVPVLGLGLGVISDLRSGRRRRAGSHPSQMPPTPGRARLQRCHGSPAGLVPVLKHDGRTLTQSLAIIDYLDWLRPEPLLIPQERGLRTEVLEVSLYVACEMHPLNAVTPDSGSPSPSAGDIRRSARQRRARSPTMWLTDLTRNRISRCPPLEFGVVDMPVVVALDAKGTSVDETGPQKWKISVEN